VPNAILKYSYNVAGCRHNLWKSMEFALTSIFIQFIYLVFFCSLRSEDMSVICFSQNIFGPRDSHWLTVHAMSFAVPPLQIRVKSNLFAVWTYPEAAKDTSRWNLRIEYSRWGLFLLEYCSSNSHFRFLRHVSCISIPAHAVAMFYVYTCTSHRKAHCAELSNRVLIRQIRERQTGKTDLRALWPIPSFKERKAKQVVGRTGRPWLFCCPFRNTSSLR
jgi:hypothetical protein